MQYKKLVLSQNTAGLIMDRLNRMLSNGITKFEGAWGDLNPTKKNVVFTTNPSVQRNTVVELVKNSSGLGTHLLIPSEGIKWFGGTVINFGDVFYLGNNVICIKSGRPDSIQKKKHLTKITLLSRGDAPKAMIEYRKRVSYLINMSLYYDGTDVYEVSEERIDRHIRDRDAKRKTA